LPFQEIYFAVITAVLLLHNHDVARAIRHIATPKDGPLHTINLGHAARDAHMLTHICLREGQLSTIMRKWVAAVSAIS
jgi:hypothetical protein